MVRNPHQVSCGACVLLHDVQITTPLSRLFVCKNYVGSMYVGGYGGLRESGFGVFRELCPVSFLVVGKSPSVR